MASLSMSSRGTVDRAPARCLGGHGWIPVREIFSLSHARVMLIISSLSAFTLLRKVFSIVPFDSSFRFKLCLNFYCRCFLSRFQTPIVIATLDLSVTTTPILPFGVYYVIMHKVYWKTFKCSSHRRG